MPSALRRSVRLLLVRHGQAGGGKMGYGPETPLTSRGHRQAGERGAPGSVVHPHTIARPCKAIAVEAIFPLEMFHYFFT